MLYISHLYYESIKEIKDISVLQAKIDTFFALGWILITLNLLVIVIDIMKVIFLGAWEICLFCVGCKKRRSLKKKLD
jgi:hypothetical protein